MSIKPEKIGFQIKNRPPHHDDHAKNYSQMNVFIRCFEALFGQQVSLFTL